MGFWLKVFKGGTGIFMLLMLSFSGESMAQQVLLQGKITNQAGKPLANARIGVKETRKHTTAQSDGRFRLLVPKGKSFTLGIFADGYQPQIDSFLFSADTSLTFVLSEVTYDLDAVTVEAEGEKGFGIRKLGSIEGVGIYEAKKTEVVTLSEITANLATNNARQVFAKVAGLNIWESDASGLQLGIGGRGLSPNRTSNFNTRQNGYDISADALGYPESYYTPPIEALNRIEVIRGAASLQYGTQFGGMVNFVMQEGAGTGRPLQVESRQTLGSWGLWNSFNSVRGEKGNFHYYAFFQHKQGNGWRPNDSFSAQTGYAGLHIQPGERWEVKLEYTGMNYLAQQPGGLTDRQFELDPRQSNRARNWFQVNWNVLSASFDYAFQPQTRLNIRTFANLSGRDALGNLERITRFDTVGLSRTLIRDDYHNVGTEIRLIHEYGPRDSSSALLIGGRVYHGLTFQQQGAGSTGSGSDFAYINPEQPDLLIDYRFPSANYAAFVEHIFRINPKLSITPGLRFEHIRTFTEGYFLQRVLDAAGNIVASEEVPETDSRIRSFLLAGVGVSYKPLKSVEVYGNFSQNYRAVTFNDLRITNPNFQVDPEIQDERGYNGDLGIRGNYRGLFYFDATVYHLFYRDRIGLLQRADEPPLFLDYRYRTNVANSRTWGLELVGELEWVRLISGRSRVWDLSTFLNLSFNHARYVDTDDPSIAGRKVELVPSMLVRTGINAAFKGFKASLQYSYVGEQFTDATNAVRTSSAVNGLIPAYYVADASFSYTWRWLTLETGINNLTDNIYFTRRATGYPGPGIIPSPGRSVYGTLGVRF